MTTVAYMRVSTTDQDHDAQRGALAQAILDRNIAGPVRWIAETCSGGVPVASRQLGVYLETEAQKGDTLITTELSRIGRSTADVLTAMQTMRERGVTLIAIRNGVTLDDSVSGRVMAVVLSLVAELEREFVRARTREGMAAARARGAKVGRPRGPAKTLPIAEHAATIEQLAAAGVSAAAIGRLIGASPRRVRRYLARM